MITNQRGFTIVEALVGVLILGMIIMVWSSLEVFTGQMVKKASDLSTGNKVILSIVNDVLTSEKGLPPSQPHKDLSKTKVTWTDLDTVFRDLQQNKLLRNICYDDRANLIIDPAKIKDCYYNVAYFKYRLDDLNYKADAQMKQIPLSRLLIRVTYADPESPEKDPAKKPQISRYLTRLVSNVAEF